jgi:DNA-binding NtrC family response regulator
MELIGQGPLMLELRTEALAAARAGVRVLITGGPGAGKEHLARFVHARSPRSHAPFTRLDGAGLAVSTLEEYLAGDLQTLFIDGIQDLPPLTQAALMAWLDLGCREHSRTRRRQVQADVHLVSSATDSLAAHIEAGGFRRELYYRLNTVHLELPPLRERREDIEPLFRHFVAGAAARRGIASPGFERGWLAGFEDYDWPGNVRELQAIAERLVEGMTPR